MRGIIRKYFPDRGFGFIYDYEGKKYFFHVSDVQPPELPEVGARVEFEAESSPKGAKAIKVHIIADACPAFVQVGKDVIRTSTIRSYGIAYQTFTEQIDHPAIAKNGPVDREVKYEVAYVKTVDGCSYIVDELDGDEPVGQVIARLNAVFGIEKPVETPLLDAEKQREQEMSALIDKYERDEEEFRASGWGTARRVFNRTLAALLILEDLLGN
jgi:cold shock CspA family protein